MKRAISSAKMWIRVSSSGCSVVWSKMVRNAPAGCGLQGDIFSSVTTRQVLNFPEATCIQPWIGLITPVPPPT